MTPSLVLPVTSQALTPVQYLSVLLRSITCDAFPRSVVKFLYAAPACFWFIPDPRFLIYATVIISVTSHAKPWFWRLRSFFCHWPSFRLAPAGTKKTHCATHCKIPIDLYLAYNECSAFKCLNSSVQSYDSPTAHERSRIKASWRRSGNHTGQPHLFPSASGLKRTLSLVMLAASSFQINIGVGGVALHASA